MPRNRLLTTLSIAVAVFCLGSASAVLAQAVHGGAVIQFESQGAPLTIDVSARIGQAGPTGIFRIGDGQDWNIGEVTDLCVIGDGAGVAVTITQGTEFPPGLMLVFGFYDAGNQGDGVPLFSPEVSACDMAALVPTVNFPVTHGNYTVAP